MPDLRRLYRRFTDSPLPTRMVAHLSVISLVALASAAGIGHVQSRGSTVATTSAETGFSIVSRVRGAGQPSEPPTSSTFVVAGEPIDDIAQLDRGASAHFAGTDPLPTPVAIDPDATPLPAPNGVGGTAASGLSTRGVAAAPATGRLVWPVPGGAISQYFHAGHLAIDIAAPYGSQVVAAQAGVVTWAGWRNNGGGNVIVIDHGNGMVTLYNHLRGIWVGVGQYVGAGQGIGSVGCTGICTGPHVHFEVIVNGIIDNPQRYF